MKYPRILILGFIGFLQLEVDFWCKPQRLMPHSLYEFVNTWKWTVC
jgi:hypothetical protein